MKLYTMFENPSYKTVPKVIGENKKVGQWLWKVGQSHLAMSDSELSLSLMIQDTGTYICVTKYLANPLS